MKILHPDLEKKRGHRHRNIAAGVGSFTVLLLVAGALVAAAPMAGWTASAVSPEEVDDAKRGSEGEGPETKVETDPVDGAELTRPARSLRVWFERAPVVAESKLTLVGPQGELQVQGLHTMGEDDLMARVVGAMPDGTYEASYVATFADGESQSGSWTFEIKRPGQAR